METVQNENIEENSAEQQENNATDATKHEKFLSMSQDSVRKAVAAIEKVGKCSNQKVCEYSDLEVERIFEAMQNALDDTKQKFKKKKEFSW